MTSLLDPMDGGHGRQQLPKKAREDRLTPEEQAAIDRHLATKGVTVVPKGQQHYDASQPRPREVREAEGRRKSARDRKFQRLREAAAAIGSAAGKPAPAAIPVNGAAPVCPKGKPPAFRPAAAPVPPKASGPTQGADPALEPLPRIKVEIEHPRHIPGWEGACRFELVRVADLRIRAGAYQRSLGRNSARRVRRLAESFDWAKFGALTVRVCDGGFEIVDGQHRAAAARARGVRAVPAIIVEGTGAEVFLGLNRDRAALDSAQLYHAELAAGDAEAAALGAILDRIGIGVPRMQGSRGLGPMETRAVSALRLELRARGETVLEDALQAMGHAWARHPGALTIETIRGIARVAAEIHAEAGDGAGPEMDDLAQTLRTFDPAALRASARSAAAKHGGAAHAHLARLVCNAHAERGGLAVAVGV